MSKKATKALILCALLSLLTGCYPTGELEHPDKPASNSNTVSDNSESDTFTMPNDLKNVKFNFELDGNYPTEAPVIKTKLRGFDVEEMKALFIDGKTVTEELLTEDGGNFYTSDGEFLGVRKGRVTYADEHLDDAEKNNIYDLQLTAVGNLRFFYLQYQNLDSELPGFPRSEALERAEEIVKKLDIGFLGEPKIYAFTSEDIINAFGGKYLDKEGHEQSKDLPKEDEFYLVRYLGEYDGIPMPARVGRIFEDVYQANEQVDILLTKDSLVEIRCDNIFDSIEAIETTQIKCSAETAVSNAYDYYSLKDNTLNYQFEYDSMGISYITYEIDYNAGEYVFKPLWHMSGTRYYEDPNGYVGRKDVDKCIDPVTGYVYDGGDWM